MKVSVLFYSLAIGFLCSTTSIEAQSLYKQIGKDRPWSEIKKNKEIPIGQTSTKGIKGSRIDVNNAAVEKGPHANRPIDRRIDIHTLGNSRVPRKDFGKWSRWYQEDGNTQVFRLHKGEHNVRNSRPGAPRIEAESITTWKEKDGKWHEWVGRYTIVKPAKASLFQIFADPVGERGGTGIMIIEMTASGDIQWNKRNRKDRRTIMKNAVGKSLDLRIRDNGYKYEVYVNGKFFESHQIKREAGKVTHFRWGIYAHDNMPSDAMVFVTGATVDPKNSVTNPNPSNGPKGYTFAANEGGTVQVQGKVNIAYGANGKFEYRRNVSSNTACNNTTFGDPIPGVRKKCYIQPVNTPVINCSFGTPTSGRLSSIANGNYTRIFVLGKGPNIGNLKRFRIKWDAGANKLTQFAFNTKNGKPSYYVDLKNKIRQSFRNGKPSVKITGSGIGVDGDYWVAKRGNDFVMASKDRRYTLYFSNSANRPNCGGQKTLLANASISIFPNPAEDVFTIDLGNTENTHVEIYNLIGQQVYKTITKGEPTLSISEDFKAGMYIIKVAGENGTTSSQSIIIK